MTFNELEKKWRDIPSIKEGYLSICGSHPLSFHIGYYTANQKCFIILNTGKIDNIPSSKSIQAECVMLSDGTYALEFRLIYYNIFFEYFIQ